MKAIDVKITNLPQIKAAFDKAPRLMVNELNMAIRRAIITISRRSRVLTPVDTGRLRASTYEHFANLKGEVGTNTNYDIFVHEGTRFMRARPYLRDAVQARNSEIEMFFRNAVDNVLNQIGRST